MNHGSSARQSHTLTLAAIGVLVAAYAATLVVGRLPQRATEAVLAHDAQASESHEATAAAHDETETSLQPPPIGMLLPFVLLLGTIAVFPLVPSIAHWWEHNLHKFYVAGGLAVADAACTTCSSTSCGSRAISPPITRSFPTRAVSTSRTAGTVLANAMLAEYVPFIVLLFSLYTISGGIRIEGDLPAHSVTNTAFLAIGGLLASLIGTTGAAMLLIRPLLETNRERKHVKHTVVFFIFIVCNCGGCLLPIGDPPLFLGYLLGVPFLWTLGLWKEWLFVNGCLLAIYFVWDHFLCYPHEAKSDIRATRRRSGHCG